MSVTAGTLSANLPILKPAMRKPRTFDQTAHLCLRTCGGRGGVKGLSTASGLLFKARGPHHCSARRLAAAFDTSRFFPRDCVQRWLSYNNLPQRCTSHRFSDFVKPNRGLSLVPACRNLLDFIASLARGARACKGAQHESRYHCYHP